jgi:hypothetical protein
LLAVLFASRKKAADWSCQRHMQPAFNHHLVGPVDHVKAMSTSSRPGSVSAMLKSIKHRLTGSKSENNPDMSAEASGVVDLGADDPSDDKPVKVGVSQGAWYSTALTHLRE